MSTKIYDLSHPEIPQASGRFGRSDLASVLAHMEGMSMAQASRCVEYICDAILFAFLQGCPVYLPKLGRLMVKITAPRRGHNPSTMTFIEYPARARGSFHLSAPARRLLEQYLIKNGVTVDVGQDDGDDNPDAED